MSNTRHLSPGSTITVSVKLNTIDKDDVKLEQQGVSNSNLVTCYQGFYWK